MVWQLDAAWGVVVYTAFHERPRQAARGHPLGGGIRVTSSRVIQQLINALNQPGEREPQKEAKKLARIGGPAVPALIEALQSSSNARIRRWSARILGELGSADAVKSLMIALHDSHMSVKLHAINALFQLNAPNLGKHLVPLIADPSGGVRVNAVAAVARLGYKRSATALVAAAKDEKWYVRQAVAKALGHLRIKQAEPTLRKLSKNARKAVREAALEALKNIAG